MARFRNGIEYTRRFRAGQELDAIQRRGVTYFTKPSANVGGVLSVAAVRRSRGATIDFSIADADGIRAVTSVIMLANDGTRSDVTSTIARTDANTFAGTSVRSNNKWRVASITITYVDATSGASHTLTENWSL